MERFTTAANNYMSKALAPMPVGRCREGLNPLAASLAPFLSRAQKAFEYTETIVECSAGIVQQHDANACTPNSLPGGSSLSKDDKGGSSSSLLSLDGARSASTG